MSTASKAPAKSTEGAKVTRKMRDNAPADGEKKKRKKRPTPLTSIRVCSLTCDLA